jgi:uncharacterized membrane protein HdeD (DUF308 family)
MNDPVDSVLLGAVAMASFLAALFFLRFWRQTHDAFFLFFAIAFGVDSIGRFALGLTQAWKEQEPFYYLMRLLTFCLIICAIILKNRPNRPK